MPMKAVFETTLGQTWLVGDVDIIGDKIGDVRIEGNKLYKCVKFFNDTATLASVAGDVVNYHAETGHVTNTVSGVVAEAGTQRLCAGVQVAAAIAGVENVAYYGWVQVTGSVTLNTDIGGSAGDGDPLTTDGAADLACDKGITIEGRCGTVMDDSAQLVMMDCHW